MNTTVCICQGNIFEGGADLTVLPASAKGTISSSCRRWVELFGLEAPPLEQRAVLGGVSDVFAFPQTSVSKTYCYAYSVFNDRSTPEALKKIGRALGKLTYENSTLRIVQAPLLGTGAGGLKNDQAAKPLIAGFAEEGHPEAMFCIFVYDSERYNSLQKLLKGFVERLVDATEVKLTFMGSGIDFKKLLK